jgi:hypothetical protein
VHNNTGSEGAYFADYRTLEEAPIAILPIGTWGHSSANQGIVADCAIGVIARVLGCDLGRGRLIRLGPPVVA